MMYALWSDSYVSAAKLPIDSGDFMKQWLFWYYQKSNWPVQCGNFIFLLLFQDQIFGEKRGKQQLFGGSLYFSKRFFQL